MLYAASDPTSLTAAVTQGGPSEEIHPARRRTGKDLRTALADTTPPDDRFTDDIAAATALLTTDRNALWAEA